MEACFISLVVFVGSHMPVPKDPKGQFNYSPSQKKQIILEILEHIKKW